MENDCVPSAPFQLSACFIHTSLSQAELGTSFSVVCVCVSVPAKICLAQCAKGPVSLEDTFYSAHRTEDTETCDSECSLTSCQRLIKRHYNTLTDM